MERDTASTCRETGWDPISQTLINQQILNQLTVLSAQLDIIETASVKKTKDKSKIKKTRAKKSKATVQATEVTGSAQECNPSPIDKLPDLAALRQDAFIQKQVKQRLKELTALQSGSEQKNQVPEGGGRGYG